MERTAKYLSISSNPGPLKNVSKGSDLHTKMPIRFWRCLVINRVSSFSGCFAFNLQARILTRGTWGHMTFLISFPWLPKLIPPQTYLMSCVVQRRYVSCNRCQISIFQSMKVDTSIKKFLLAGSLLSYQKSHTRCQCKQQLNMRCSPLLATASSTFLWDFFLMIIFIYGTALHHSTDKNQAQTEPLL